MWTSYIDGLSLRKISSEQNISIAQTYRRISRELEQLPRNTDLTSKNCERFCGILILDGKYVKVRGYPRKIPFIYGIDYLTHDIPVGLLASAENEEHFLELFRQLKSCHYPLKIVVCDDVVGAIKPELFQHYPDAKIQLCHNYYVENICQQLNIRTKELHQHFFSMLYRGVFQESKAKLDMSRAIYESLKKRAQRDAHRQLILKQIEHRRWELFAHHEIPDCPKDTNLVELFNSHLNARLRALKGFKSFQAAEQWLNGFLIRRRTKAFTDCDEKFRHLNGKCSLQMSLAPDEDICDVFEKIPLKMHPK